MPRLDFRALAAAARLVLRFWTWAPQTTAVTGTRDIRVYEALLASIVRSADAAVVGRTREGIISSWNPAAERLYGYSAAEAVGRPVSMLVPAERQAEKLKIVAKALEGERVARYETERMDKDGRRSSVSPTVAPTRDSQGVVVGVSAIEHALSAAGGRDSAAREAQAYLEERVPRCPDRQHRCA